MDAGGRARLEERILAEQELAHVDRMKAVDVLAVIDGAENLVLLEVAWQRRLDENAVDLGVAIEAVDQREQFRLRRLLLQHDRIRFDAQFRRPWCPSSARRLARPGLRRRART